MGSDEVTTEGASMPSDPEIETFLNLFFSEPNRLTLARVTEAQGPAAESVRGWIADLRQSRGFVALPCLRADRREWYGLAFSERQYRSLLELIGAFVGPSYSTFRGDSGGMSATDPVDRATLDFTGGHALKFEVPNDEPRAAAARDALDRMRLLLRRRGTLGAEAPKPTGRILRDYYMALRAGDRPAAARHLRRLETGFRLDPINLLYLRVQEYAEFAEWETLLGLPELPDLLSLRRPVAVTQALLTAVFRTFFADREEPGDLQEIVEQFRTEVYPRFAALFTSRAGLRGEDAQKLYMLFAVAGPAPSAELRDQILAEVSATDLRAEFVRRLGGLLPPTVTPATRESAIDRAGRAAHRGQYDEAFGIAVNLSASVERARVLLDSAYGLGSIETAKTALDALNELGNAGRTVILADRRRKDAFEFLQAQAPVSAEIAKAATLPANWYEWVDAVEERPTWPHAVQVARRGAAEWRLEEFLNDGRAPSEFAERLRDASAHETTHLALPHLLEFFEGDPNWPRRELAPVYRIMTELLVFTSGIGDEDLAVFHQLVEALLSLGQGEQTYAELLQYASDLLRDYSAPKRIDWALDMLDLFMGAECPRPDLRISFAASLAAKLQKYTQRVSTTQHVFFRELCKELGHPELVPPQSDASGAGETDTPRAVDLCAKLANRSVAVYTLTENAGRRFAEMLKRRCPTVAVETNHDHVATTRLKHLARNSDVFVMVTGSAKHAATLFIQSERPPARPLLRPAGKGTASMLRALLDHAAAH
jgi:hypothetical protein